MQLAPRIHRLGDGRIDACLIADATDVSIIDVGVPGHWGERPGEPGAMGAMGRTLDAVPGAAFGRIPETGR